MSVCCSCARTCVLLRARGCSAGLVRSCELVCIVCARVLVCARVCVVFVRAMCIV